MSQNDLRLKLIPLGINTYTEPVIYMREDCDLCKSEGFAAQARVNVTLNGKSMIATLNTVESDLLRHNEASLSTYAWHFLNANENDKVTISHPKPLESVSFIRSKVYGNELKTNEINQIISDLMAGLLSDIDVTMFLSGAAGKGLNVRETLDLTRAMLNTGDILQWPSKMIVDKHCVGGLPGNRTTLIVVPIVAAFGLMIPKTSSRAITSPAGTADVMEVFAPVNLTVSEMRRVVERENGCIAWGGSVSLSPADDLLVRIERAMDLDSEGQLVASILSKKIAAGSNHLVIDMPIGTTAKVRNVQQAELIKTLLEKVAYEFDIKIHVMMTDGTQPVGRGIGPTLEAQDVMAVLSNANDAPYDLRDRSLMLAGHIIEFAPNVTPGTGRAIAKTLLDSGEALNKFISICEAQGGMAEIPRAEYTCTIKSFQAGRVVNIDNRHLARLAKLAGAPNYKTSGVEMHVRINTYVERGQPLFTIHAETEGLLSYAQSYLEQGHPIIYVE